MILYEFEGKKLLQQAGINVPAGQVVTTDNLEQIATSLIAPRDDKVVLKAQVLSGKRAEAGGIIKIDNAQRAPGGAVDNVGQLFKKTINREKVERVLVEELVEYEGPEYYLSISYDTDTRGPILTISNSGGTGVEGKETQKYSVDPINQAVIPSKEGIQEEGLFMDPDIRRDDIVNKLIKLFFEQDCLLLEINPLVKSKDKWIALDAKVKLDDDALSRHQDWDFSPRSAPGHNPTQNEIEAKKIDQGDYRGTAGSAYFDLDGDIAILASGGGASLTAMDALIKAGGKPGNYTEYSGNPPKEKVSKLTQIVLSKPNIHGLWVVGAVANFTDIYETLSGFIEALKTISPKPRFPIVIRRGGPRDKEAFEMLKKIKDFDLHLYGEETSITRSAEIMADLAQKYQASLRGTK